MNDKDNARYWVEYHNLDKRADIIKNEIRKNLNLRLKRGEIDEDTFCQIHRLSWDLFEKDEKKLEFKERFRKAYSKPTWWQKFGKKLDIWDEHYIKGPNEDMLCIACDEPLKSPRHDTLACSTNIIYKRYVYNKNYKDKIRRVLQGL